MNHQNHQEREALNIVNSQSLSRAFVCFVILCSCLPAAADEVIPFHQDRPPGPALSPAQAIAKMTVPEGFAVELIAAEPDIVNPVAMCFDERGRIWIAESLEYPRHAPGKGRDRIKVLEDTDGDGRADKFTTFAEGLNIPSGIAVGHGGVWVANAPDILFMQDTDGDSRADKTEVVVTGFGRHDTHELPNSLTWGPDGYLYGCNGIFNPSRVEQDGIVHEFDGAIFRIDPRTRKFELFARGISNQWGIAFNENGEMFVSACVIDHLWHVTQGGYYIRQAGPYPPHTWPMESIVDHKHQKAAYCGIVWFDSDQYPEEFRRKLYMGNIHNGCINADALERNGSTYRGLRRPDLMTANDAWFMPVAQKVGPDGNLYILDWYDRYHCYQDAMRDAPGIDRLKGRLYRLRYTGSDGATTVRERSPDLSAESDDQLIVRLSSPNVFIRETAQRLLNERDNAETRPKLKALVLDGDAPRQARLHALWALISTGRLEKDFHLALLGHDDATFRAWAVRALDGADSADPQVMGRARGMVTTDPSADVRLQLAIVAQRGALSRSRTCDAYFALKAAGDDPLIPKIVWQHHYPYMLERIADGLVSGTHGTHTLLLAAGNTEVARRAVELLLGTQETQLAEIVSIVKSAISRPQRDIAEYCLNVLAEQTQTGQLGGERLAELRKAITPTLNSALNSELSRRSSGPVLLAATWGHTAGVEGARRILAAHQTAEADRLGAVRALVHIQDALVIELAVAQIASGSNSLEHRKAVIAALGRSDDDALAEALLGVFPKVEATLQPAIADLLVGRTASATALLDEIEGGRIDRGAVNLNQVRSLALIGDETIKKRVEKLWGRVRTERNPDREKVIESTRRMLAKTSGDPSRGREVFRRVCAQCHVIFGEGQQVGPDLTGSGRGSFEQLLSNVVDPNLVVGEVYQLRTLTTTDGRTLAGMLAEDNAERLVLRIIGGQSQTIPREQVKEVNTLPVSFMPEGLEQSMTPQELADLFAFLMKAD